MEPRLKTGIPVEIRRHQPQLLITDVDMPGTMEGTRLAHFIRRRWPPILVTVVAFGVAYAVGRSLIVSPGANTLTASEEAIGIALLIAILVLFCLYRGSRRALWRSLR